MIQERNILQIDAGRFSCESECLNGQCNGIGKAFFKVILDPTGLVAYWAP